MAWTEPSGAFAMRTIVAAVPILFSSPSYRPSSAPGCWENRPTILASAAAASSIALISFSSVASTGISCCGYMTVEPLPMTGIESGMRIWGFSSWGPACAACSSGFFGCVSSLMTPPLVSTQRPTDRSSSLADDELHVAVDLAGHLRQYDLQKALRGAGAGLFRVHLRRGGWLPAERG